MFKKDVKIMVRNEYTNEIRFSYGSSIVKASLCICKFSDDLMEKYMEKCIHPLEMETYTSLKNEKIKNYILGMYTAKKAVSELIHQRDLKEIIIGKGIFNQPILMLPLNHNIHVSITHCLEYGIAIAIPQGYPIGIDLESVNDRSNRVSESQLTKHEKEILNSHNLYSVLLWTIKESLSKVLMTGISTPFQIYEIDKLILSSKFIVSYFKNFLQYKAISISLDKYIFSVVYPKKFKIEFDSESLKNTLNNNM